MSRHLATEIAVTALPFWTVPTGVTAQVRFTGCTGKAQVALGPYIAADTMGVQGLAEVVEAGSARRTLGSFRTVLLVIDLAAIEATGVTGRTVPIRVTDNL